MDCRKLKKIILALRGTMTIADLVTDAVCHPEPLDSWLPDVSAAQHADALHSAAWLDLTPASACPVMQGPLHCPVAGCVLDAHRAAEGSPCSVCCLLHCKTVSDDGYGCSM